MKMILIAIKTYFTFYINEIRTEYSEAEILLMLQVARHKWNLLYV